MVRKGIIAGAVFLIAFFIVLYIFGSRSIAALSKDILARQTLLKGAVSAQQIDADWSGKVHLTDVVWKDEHGYILLKAPEVQLSMNFFKAVFEGGTEAVIRKISLQEPEFFYDIAAGGGLTEADFLRDKINTADDKKVTGLLKIDNGIVHISAGKEKFELQDVNAAFDIKDSKLMSGDASAVYKEAELSWDADTAGYMLKVRNVPAGDLLKTVNCSKNTVISQGLVDVEIHKDQGQLTVNGLVKDAAGMLFDLPVTSLNGAFHGNNDTLTVTKMALLLAGQPINVSGSILLPNASQSKAEYKLQFNSGTFGLNVLSAGIDITDGVTVQGKITGSFANPVLEGNFGVKSLDFSPLLINELHGSFLYFADKLNIANAVGQVESGAVKADGEIILKNGEFKFNLLAENIPAGLLTDNQISGNITFDATVIGANEKQSAVSLGDFAITEGKYKGVPFSKITGVVHHNKAGYKFSDVYLHTFAGKIPMDAILLDNGKLRFSD